MLVEIRKGCWINTDEIAEFYEDKAYLGFDACLRLRNEAFFQRVVQNVDTIIKAARLSQKSEARTAST